MKNIYKALCFVVLATMLVACPKDDSPTLVQLREYKDVYEEDILEIEDYLKSNYLTVDSEMNATVSVIPEGGSEVSIWDQTDYPLRSITVKNDSRRTYFVDGRVDDDVDYKLYYIVLNEGGGTTPTSVDSTFTAYKGWNLSNEIFDQNTQGVWSSFPEPSVSFISGYRQILSQIKTEGNNPIDNGDGTFSRVDFGNVIVFIPSGLAYFNNSRQNINEYSPICFQIKLYTLRQRDHDGDKVMSIYEDLDNNGDYFNDDTDGDKLPNIFDRDDDGDGIITKKEIIETDDNNGNITYYSFANIPLCNGGLRVHLDPNCRD